MAYQCPTCETEYTFETYRGRVRCDEDDNPLIATRMHDCSECGAEMCEHCLAEGAETLCDCGKRLCPSCTRKTEWGEMCAECEDQAKKDEDE